MKKWKKISLGLLSLAVLAYGGASAYLASSIVRPKTLTLAQEEAWEKEHGMWNDYDQLEKTDYTVAGEGNYQLHASLVKAADTASQKYVIITHGFRSNRHGAVKYVEVYRQLGYNCIVYDVRGHGDNQPTTVSLGNIEAKDLWHVIEDTYRRFGEDIHLGLQGESMGSSISLNVLKYHPKIQFVVADCGFTNLHDLIASAYETNGVGFLMPGVDAVTRYIYGVDMRQTSAIDAVKDNTMVPITFIHGENDTFITPENSDQLAAANASSDTVTFVENAAHAESREVLGIAAYQELVKQNPNIATP